MFVYTNIGLSQKIHELKICNSGHFYIRPVLVCVVNIIDFAQRELGLTVKRLKQQCFFLLKAWPQPTFPGAGAVFA